MKNNQIKIIGGEYRSRTIEVIDKDGLRPTSSRSRETLFNWLQHEIANATCLDFCAGSGALGIEALSRGAKHVTFIEKDSAVFKILQQNLQKLTIESSRYTLIKGDAISWLQKQHHVDASVVFIDPPFAAELYETIFSLLHQTLIQKTIKALIIEAPPHLSLNFPVLKSYLTLHRQTKTKHSQLSYYTPQ